MNLKKTTDYRSWNFQDPFINFLRKTKSDIALHCVLKVTLFKFVFLSRKTLKLEWIQNILCVFNIFFQFINFTSTLGTSCVILCKTKCALPPYFIARTYPQLVLSSVIACNWSTLRLNGYKFVIKTSAVEPLQIDMRFRCTMRLCTGLCG